MGTPPGHSPETAILAAIRAIPRGQVAGYGHVARRAGLPGRARLVARILGGNDDPRLPWHRVLRSDGRIALPPGSKGWREQVMTRQPALEKRFTVAWPMPREAPVRSMMRCGWLELAGMVGGTFRALPAPAGREGERGPAAGPGGTRDQG